MISIDTGLMRQLVSASNTANAEIDKAVTSLNRVATHYDWECPEKVVINNYTEQNKKAVRRLQENSRNFLNALTNTVQEFENSENSINNLFSGLEALIGAAAALPVFSQQHVFQPPFQMSNIREIIEAVMNNKTDTGYNTGFHPEKIINYEIENFCSPIAICSFSDLNLNGGVD